MLSLIAVAVACTDANRPYRAASTVRMAERLDSLARYTDANPDPYANTARLDLMRAQTVGRDLRSQMLYRAGIAEQLLRAGQSQEAVQAFEEIGRLIDQNRESIPADYAGAIDDMLAMTYLRVAQQENCPPAAGALPCSLSTWRDGAYEHQAAARNAIAVYERMLASAPDTPAPVVGRPRAGVPDYAASAPDGSQNLVQRWLLNVAYMMVGEYPDSVPERWLIPAEAIGGAEFDIGEFRDVAPQLGLNAVGLAGGGIAEDFDGDGYLDIMASSMGQRDQIKFFRNGGDGTFQDRTIEAGLEGLHGGLNAMQTDYNNDGFADVLVLRGAWLPEGHYNSLLRNNGDGTFEDVTEEAGLLDAYPTQTAAWGDFDNDGWLDVFIGNESRPEHIHPSQLFRNNGDGTFTDIARQADVADIGFTKGVTAGDYDNDGRLDLYLSRLVAPNLLFHNEGVGADGIPRFREVSAVAGVREPEYSFPTWFFDYDNDGWEDLFVSGFLATSGDAAAEYLGLDHNGELPRLYRNNGDGTFTNASAEARMDTRVLLTMGSNFGDLDNDGFLDFYATTGDPHFRSYMPDRMFRNSGTGFFQEVTTSGRFGNMQKGHGVSFADFDHDGDQDIHHVAGGAYEGDVYHNALYVNPGHGNRWITLRLEGVRSNRAAIGVRVRVTVETVSGDRDIYRTVTTGSSFGANPLRLQIGLGNAIAIRAITVTWPASAIVDIHRNVAMDRFFLIREGADQPEALDVGRFDLADALPDMPGR